MILIAALLAIATSQTSWEKVAARDEADRKAIAEITFEGFDASDPAVVASAQHYCGKTEECSSSFLAARSAFIRAAALERRQKAGLKILRANAQAEFVDWRVALNAYQSTYHPPRVEALSRMTTTCRSYFGKRSVYTRCSSY